MLRVLRHVDRLAVILDGEANGVAENVNLLHLIRTARLAESNGLVVSIDQ